MAPPTLSHSSLKSRTSAESSECTVQCPTPTASAYNMGIPYEGSSQKILEKANKVRLEQRRLIAAREIENKLASPSSDKTVSNPHTNGVALAIDIYSAKSQGDSYTVPNTAPASSLATPPTSTTESTAGDIPKRKPTAIRPPPGIKRHSRPQPLDVDALCRERQYSGPYSANPLLSRKRDFETMQYFDESKVNQPQNIPRSAASALPPIIPAPFVSRKLLHLQMPFPASPLGLPSLSPSLARQPQSGSSSLREGMQEGSRHISNSDTSISSCCSDSSSSESVDTGAETTQTTFTNKTAGQIDRKSKFIDLCGQIWDLVNEK